MKEHQYSPAKLDVAAFARDGASLSGELPAAALLRLADAAAPEAPASAWPAVTWQVTGERRELRGGEAQTWLHLEAQATVRLTCQRCLQPVDELIALSHSFRFVKDEAEALSVDPESEEDLLALTRSLDVIELLEDELLLSCLWCRAMSNVRSLWWLRWTRLCKSKSWPKSAHTPLRLWRL